MTGTQTPPIPIAIDCDPGVDDAIALLLALGSPELDVRGVTTVAGNVSLADVDRNAARVLDLAGASPGLPLVSGMDGPIARVGRVRDEPAHGAGGIGGLELPASDRRFGAEHAVDWLATQAMAAPGELTLVAIGPLSNVASMLRRHPGAGEALREIVIMGGAAFAQGNITPAAEFNFYADPEAARVVLESGLPVRIVGLDVTRAAPVPLETAMELAARPGATGFAGRLLEGYARRAQQSTGSATAVASVHDALTVASVTHPDLITWDSGEATVECAGEVTRGALVADVRGPERSHTTRVARAVDAARFTRLLGERLAHYAEPKAPA